MITHRFPGPFGGGFSTSPIFADKRIVSTWCVPISEENSQPRLG